MNKFIILGVARSGTSNLSACLGNGILSEKIVQEPFLFTSGDRDHYSVLKNEQDKRARGLLGGYYSQNVWPKNCKDAFDFLDALYCNFTGIKHIITSSGAFLNRMIIEYAVHNNIKIIFQSRKSLLDCSISDQLTHVTGVIQWSKDGKSKVDNSEYQPIDLTKILSVADVWYAKIDQCKFWMRLYKPEVKYLRYEETFMDNLPKKLAIISDLCEFLGISFSDLDYNWVKYHYLENKKLNTSKNLEKIPNYREFLKLKEEYDRIFVG